MSDTLYQLCLDYILENSVPTVSLEHVEKISRDIRMSECIKLCANTATDSITMEESGPTDYSVGHIQGIMYINQRKNYHQINYKAFLESGRQNNQCCPNVPYVRHYDDTLFNPSRNYWYDSFIYF